MHSNAFHRANLAAAVAIGIAGTGFLLLRAHALSFTHDEALTWLHAIRPGLGRLFTFAYPNANNHLLNSLLGWGTGRVIGPSEWALRLPNVLAFAVFVLASFRLLQRRVAAALVVPGLLLLVCNPFQLDFFALCRGYGLALAFTLLALDFALSSLDDPVDRSLSLRRRDAVAAGAFAALATLANLAWLNFFLALLAALGALQWVRTRRDDGAASFARNWLLPQLPVTVALAAILIPVVTTLRAEGALYLGGDASFWHDTVGRLVESSLYARPYAAAVETPLAIAGAAGLLAATLVAFAGARRAGPGSSREGALLLVGTLALCVASVQLQHQLFGTKFLTDRTALFLLPNAALLVVFACDSLGRAGRTAAIVLAAIATLHTAGSLNTSHTLTWAYDADTRRMLDDLRAFVAEHPAPPRPFRLGAEWVHQPSIDYYRKRDGLDWLAPMSRKGFERERDFYFYREDPLDPALTRIPLRAIARYPQSGHSLAHAEGSFE